MISVLFCEISAVTRTVSYKEVNALVYLICLQYELAGQSVTTSHLHALSLCYLLLNIYRGPSAKQTGRQYVPTSQQCDHDIQHSAAFSSYLSTNTYTYNFYNDIVIRTSAYGSQTPGCKPSAARGLIQGEGTTMY